MSEVARGVQPINLEGYKSIVRNRKNGNMGGVAIAFREEDENNVLKMSEMTSS